MPPNISGVHSIMGRPRKIIPADLYTCTVEEIKAAYTRATPQAGAYWLSESVIAKHRIYFYDCFHVIPGDAWLTIVSEIDPVSPARLRLFYILRMESTGEVSASGPFGTRAKAFSTLTVPIR